MNVVLKAVEIVDPASPHHQQTVNLFLKNGIIEYIGPELPEADEEIEIPGLCASVGWLDMHALVTEPGAEHKEDLETAAMAAANGGFTEVVCLPNVDPVTQTKNAIAYLKTRSQALPVTFHAMGAVTTDCEGKELTEMIDMYEAGAVAFSDGKAALQQADVLLKTLQYLQYVNVPFIQRPENQRLSEYGQINEGIVSTRLGMKGIPHLTEEIMVARDLQLLAYAGGRLHISLLSSAGSVNMIRKAKAKGLAVTCDVAAYQMSFTDETIIPFDTNYKVNPPFRTAADTDSLIAGLFDGTIDALVSGHTPQDPESKNLEFDHADFGIINLETAFAAAHTVLRNHMPLEQIIRKFTVEPRRILNLPVPVLQAGEQANITLFHPGKAWRPMAGSSASKSKNSPFFGQELTGQVFGIIHKNRFTRNQNF